MLSQSTRLKMARYCDAISEGLGVRMKHEQPREGPDAQSRSVIVLQQIRELRPRSCCVPTRNSGGLEQLSFFDLLCEFRRRTDWFQLRLRSRSNNLCLHSECASAARQQLSFQTLRELAGLRRARVIYEAAPSGVLFDAEVTWRAFEECAPIEARLRRRRFIVRGTTHHRNPLKEL